MVAIEKNVVTDSSEIVRVELEFSANELRQLISQLPDKTSADYAVKEAIGR